MTTRACFGVSMITHSQVKVTWRLTVSFFYYRVCSLISTFVLAFETVMIYEECSKIKIKEISERDGIKDSK